MAKKRKGHKPSAPKNRDPDLSVQDALTKLEGRADGYPLLSFRFIEKDWGFEPLSDAQRLAFLTKWHKRSRYSWKELVHHRRHELGSETMPAAQIKPQIPRQFTDVEKFLVFRHEDRHPMVGWRSGDVFYAIWIEAKYGDLYDH